MPDHLTTTDVASKTSTQALAQRIAAATPAEREALRAQLKGLSVRPGVKSGQQGRIRAMLALVDRLG